MKSISNVLVCMSLCGLVSTRLVAEELPNVTGKVIDEIGNAVANADVTFLPYADYLEDVEQLYTRTDAKGEFALRVTRPMMYFQRSRVVAWKEGYGVGSAEVSPAGATASWGERKTLPVAQNLEIQLPKRSQPLRFQLVSPDGDPVRQVPVAVMAIYKSFAAGEYHLHTTHADGLPCLLRSTDANGMVDFDFLASGNFMAFMVKTENWGDQVGWVTAQQPEDDDRQLKLQPISKVRIQLKAQDQSPISGRKIRYSSQVEAMGEVETAVMAYFNASQGVLETNQDGVAEANILAGKAWFSLQASPDDTSFEDHSRLNDVVLKAGSQTNLEISLEPGISVVGRVIDGDDKPVPGVELTDRVRTYVTDDEGRYTALANPRTPTYIQVTAVPNTYAMPFSNGVSITPTDLEPSLNDIIVQHAVTLTGKVVDSQGKSAAGVELNAAWIATDDTGLITYKSVGTKADAEGEFELKHVLKDVDVVVTAQSETMASEAKSVHTDQSKSLELTIDETQMLRVVGALRGLDGQAVRDAKLRISTSLTVPGQRHSYGQRRVSFLGREYFDAQESGEFVSPTSLPRSGRYSLVAEAPGYRSLETEFRSSEEGDLDFGELQLVPTRHASGTVVDSQGKPVAGAVVSAFSAEQNSNRGTGRVRSETDGAGRFALEGLHPHAAVALIKKDGFRNSGAFLIKDQQIQVTLYATDEAIPIDDQIVVRTGNEAERFAAAKWMLSELKKTRSASGYFEREINHMLLRIGRDEAVAGLEQVQSATNRTELLTELGEFDEALAESANIENPYRRCLARVAIAEAATEESVWRSVLSTSLAESDLIQSLDSRLIAVCKIVHGFHQKGDHAQAEKIVRGQTDLAKSLSSDSSAQYALGCFATELARFDFEQAMKLANELSEQSKFRCYQNIAHRLADIRPEQAEQVVRQTEQGHYLDAPAVRVAYRMAKVDLPRAISLLDTIPQRSRPAEPARAYGAMAIAVMDSEPDKAKELLSQAYAALATKNSYRSNDIFGAALTLLQYAEQVDPNHLTDYFWRTVEFYSGPDSGFPSPDERATREIDRQAKLAILLAMYNVPEEIVRQVSHPIFEHWEHQVAKPDMPKRFSDYRATLVALALANPDRAAQWAISFEQKIDADARRTIPQPWEVIGQTLTRNHIEIGQYITEVIYHRWTIGQYDF